MTDVTTKPRTKVRLKPKPERPRLHKVILLNDDYTPREFVVMVLKAVFRMGEETAYAVMLTAHRRGACVIAVFTKDVAETKAPPHACVRSHAMLLVSREKFKPHTSVTPLAVLCLSGDRRTSDPHPARKPLHRSFPRKRESSRSFPI